MIKIEIAERADRIRGIAEVARRGRVISLPDDIFIVPEPALELLSTLGCGYREIERGGWDFAVKALANAYAAKANC